MGKKKTTHDRAVDELEEKVKANYHVTLKNVEYFLPHSRDTAGELDLVGIRGNNWDIYEVKSTNGFETAVKQLSRAYHILTDVANIRTFYYSGKQKKIQEVHHEN